MEIEEGETYKFSGKIFHYRLEEGFVATVQFIEQNEDWGGAVYSLTLSEEDQLLVDKQTQFFLEEHLEEGHPYQVFVEDVSEDNLCGSQLH